MVAEAGTAAGVGAGTHPLRVLVLWTQMSGYLDACLVSLAARDVEVRVAYRHPSGDAPFDPSAFASLNGGYGWVDEPDPLELAALVEDHQPDALLVGGWSQGAYRELAGTLSGRCLRVLCFDNQWLARPRQFAGVATSRRLLRPNFDVVFVPGDTQARFARLLGYGDDLQLHGLYCADHERFAAVATDRSTTNTFGFVGRLVPEKGVDVLASAYRSYRSSVADPWPLVVAGVGPLESELRHVPGVELRGFLQPDDLPSLLTEFGALTLPSRFEPWGVVLHEAAAAGLPLIATGACGAASRLLLDGYNGLRVRAGSESSLAKALQRFASYPAADRAAMGKASESLALQYTPQRWAHYVHERIAGYGASWGHSPTL
jgi:glycosyltransferase involved in cell wall biosynthesis